MVFKCLIETSPSALDLWFIFSCNLWMARDFMIDAQVLMSIDSKSQGIVGRVLSAKHYQVYCFNILDSPT